MADKELTTEDALDIISPSEDGTSADEAIDAAQERLDMNSGVSEDDLEDIEKRTSRLRARASRDGLVAASLSAKQQQQQQQQH